MKYPQHSNFMKSMENYLKGKVNYRAMSCVIPSLGADYIEELDKKLNDRRNNL